MTPEFKKLLLSQLVKHYDLSNFNIFFNKFFKEIKPSNSEHKEELQLIVQTLIDAHFRKANSEFDFKQENKLFMEKFLKLLFDLKKSRNNKKDFLEFSKSIFSVLKEKFSTKEAFLLSLTLEKIDYMNINIKLFFLDQFEEKCRIAESRP